MKLFRRQRKFTRAKSHFLPIFSRQAALGKQAAAALYSLARTDDKTEWARLEKEIKQCEIHGDALLAEFYEAIYEVLLYPVDRDDLQVLAIGMDEFLDQPAQGQMTENDFLENSSSVSSLTNSIYTTYREGSAWETIGSWIGDLCSDNALRGSSLSDGGGTIFNNGVNQFQNMSGLNGGSDFLNWLWNNAYTGIGRANTALKAIREFDGIDPRQKEILEGEARFNRAWFYFSVLKHWGKGPIVPLETLTGAEMADIAISDRTTLYDSIMADLEAGLLMPDKEEASQWYPTSWYGRAHWGSAMGLMAKVLLYRAADEPERANEYYTRIVSIVKEMELSDDGYGLEPLSILFSKLGEYGSESVFEIGAASFMTSDGAYQGWQVVGVRSDPNWGWGFVAPSLNLVQSYEPGDNRKENDIIYGRTTAFSGMEQTPSVIDGTTIVGSYIADDPASASNGFPNRFTRKGYQPRPVTGGNENYGGNIRLMRWAEVLLIGAEAAVQCGDAKASEWYNAVRARAGLGEKEATLENIWEEKRIELSMERDRYFDLVRIDKIRPGYFAAKVWAKIQSEQAGLELMKELGIATESTFLPLPTTSPVETPKNYVLPIPNEQILLMNNLEQNNGY